MQDLPVGLGRTLRGLLSFAARCSVADSLERGRRGRCRGVGVHPSQQGRGTADEATHLLEVTLHDALQVTVEEVGACGFGQAACGREPRADDLTRIVLQPDVRLTLDRSSLAAEQPAQTHRRHLDATLGESQRAHPQRQDATSPGVRTVLTRRAREQVAARWRSVVDRPADHVPRGGNTLPLIDQDRGLTAEHDLRVGCNHLAGGAVETVVRVRSALCSLCLADRLGPLDRDGGELGRLLIELIVEDTVQIRTTLGSLAQCTPRAHTSMLPIAGHLRYR